MFSYLGVTFGIGTARLPMSPLLLGLCLLGEGELDTFGSYLTTEEPEDFQPPCGPRRKPAGVVSSLRSLAGSSWFGGVTVVPSLLAWSLLEP
jgi:hypothetical protein